MLSTGTMKSVSQDQAGHMAAVTLLKRGGGWETVCEGGQERRIGVLRTHAHVLSKHVFPCIWILQQPQLDSQKPSAGYTGCRGTGDRKVVLHPALFNHLYPHNTVSAERRCHTQQCQTAKEHFPGMSGGSGEDVRTT